MKPIKLIISGFGPYAKTMPEIDFTQFEDKGLFLLCGETGAGKTTIFDAICFALFGRTSGEYKSENEVRCEYLENGTDSFVDFYFEHQGKNYHIKRTTPYSRINRSGVRVLESGSVALFEDGKTPIEGIKSVKKAIEELLNVDFDQFKQLVMIPQGEFLKLLNAKTDERTKIFRRIFCTEKYYAMEGNLKAKMDQVYGEKNTQGNSIIQYFGGVKPCKDDNLQTEFEAIKAKYRDPKGLNTVDEMIDIIERINGVDNNEAEKLKNYIEDATKVLNELNNKKAIAETNNGILDKVKGLEEKQTELDNKKEGIDEKKSKLEKQKKATREALPKYNALEKKNKEIESTEKSIEEERKNLKNLEDKIKVDNETLSDAKQKKPEAEEKRRNADRIKNDKEKYENRDILLARLNDLKKTETDLKESDKDLSEQENSLREKIEGLSTRLEDLKNCETELAEATTVSGKINALLEQISNINDVELPEYRQSDKAYVAAKKEFENARDLYEEAKNKYDNGERTLENSRIGIIASKLEEGKPCPVCGSVHHPEKAVIFGDVISEEEVKKLKKDAESKERDKGDKFAIAEAAKREKELRNGQLINNIQKCLSNELIGEQTDETDIDTLAEKLSKCKSNIQILKENSDKKLEDAKNRCEEFETAQSDLKDARENTQKELERKRSQLNSDIQNNRTQIAEAEGNINGIGELGYSNWNEASQIMENAYKEAQAIEDSIANAEKTVSDNSNLASEKNGRINTLEGNLTTQVNDKAELEEALNSCLSENSFESADEMLSYGISEATIKDIENEISEYETSVKMNAGAISEAKKEAEGKTYIDINEITNQCEEKENQLETLREDYNGIKNRISHNTDIKNSIFDGGTKYVEITHRCSMLSRLYNMIKGKEKGAKITLEQFIQAAGFDGILRAANERLKPMTDYQYELYRVEDSSDDFLDLEVLDNYSGHKRSVGNLSGGESFKASLALALGLSDVVSSSLGGVQMDATFIDEGFGTLDKKSIESALDVLLNLSRKNKLVGVISHRDELFAAIPQKIIVSKTKDRKGSEFTIDTGE